MRPQRRRSKKKLYVKESKDALKRGEAVPKAVVAGSTGRTAKVRGRSNRKRLIRRSISGVFRVRWSSKDREYGLTCYEIGFDVEL